MGSGEETIKKCAECEKYFSETQTEIFGAKHCLCKKCFKKSSERNTMPRLSHLCEYGISTDPQNWSESYIRRLPNGLRNQAKSTLNKYLARRSNKAKETIEKTIMFHKAKGKHNNEIARILQKHKTTVQRKVNAIRHTPDKEFKKNLKRLINDETIKVIGIQNEEET